MDTSDPVPGHKVGRVMKLTTHLHLEPRSRMCRAIYPLPQYASMAWCSVKEKQRDNFTFTFFYILKKCIYNLINTIHILPQNLIDLPVQKTYIQIFLCSLYIICKITIAYLTVSYMSGTELRHKIFSSKAVYFNI
jgi:hypothetical protein